MSELGRKKLETIVKDVFRSWENIDEKYHKAKWQIIEMIQSHPNLKQGVAQGQGNLKNKSLMKLAEDLGVSFSAAKIISDHAWPGVTKESIKDHDKMTEHELRTEVLKLRAKINRLQQKPGVTEAWIEEKAKLIVGNLHLYIDSKQSYYTPDSSESCRHYKLKIKIAKNFIRSFLEEIRRVA